MFLSCLAMYCSILSVSVHSVPFLVYSVSCDVLFFSVMSLLSLCLSGHLYDGCHVVVFVLFGLVRFGVDVCVCVSMPVSV